MFSIDELRKADQAGIIGNTELDNFLASKIQPDPVRAVDSGPITDLPPEMQPTSDEAKAAVAGTDARISMLQDQLAHAMHVMQVQATQLAAYAPKAPEPIVMKRYRSNLPFIGVPIMRAPGYCSHVQFIAGILDTEDPAVQDVLNKCIAAGGLGFSYDGTVEPIEGTDDMSQDIANVATRAHARMIAAGQSTA